MIAKAMGHSTTRMTEKYARPEAQVARDVVAEALKAVETARAGVGAGPFELPFELPAETKINAALAALPNP